MTGPEHYREAEQLLANAGADTAQTAYGAVQLNEPPSPLIAAAQVHATLALAAATALTPTSLGGKNSPCEWGEIAQ